MKRMTLFKLMSDLHLEFFQKDVWKPIPSDNDKNTVLLLAGDIHVGTKAKDWLIEMCGRYKYVIYILGNHEFYRQEFYKLQKTWENMEDMPENFRFLNKGVAYIEDTRILGATLWTLVKNPHNRWFIQQGMGDYRVIKINDHGNYRRLNTQDTDRAFTETLYFLQEELRKPWPGRTIVMTHHLPHPICVAERFKNNPYNEAYMTNLDYFFENFNIDVWCHGHTHDTVDTHVGKTRILCNPRGYHGYETNPDFNEDLIV